MQHVKRLIKGAYQVETNTPVQTMQTPITDTESIRSKGYEEERLFYRNPPACRYRSCTFCNNPLLNKIRIGKKENKIK
jgi:hypothetical protein